MNISFGYVSEKKCPVLVPRSYGNSTFYAYSVQYILLLQPSRLKATERGFEPDMSLFADNLVVCADRAMEVLSGCANIMTSGVRAAHKIILEKGHGFR